MDDAENASKNFRVELGGIVELLSRNLYSGPRVFVRELVQNGMDAITARSAIDPDCPKRIRFITDGSRLTVIDTGIGLDPQEAEGLLATIGATSKRDEFGFARGDYLGQFGIGLLSCFMVSSSIRVYSRSGKRGAPDVVTYWQGNSDGTWSCSTADPQDAPVQLSGPGTAVVLEKMSQDHYFDHSVLVSLLTMYAQYLPCTITVETTSGIVHTITGARPPWDCDEKAAALWCHETFGFSPFACIPLRVEAAGLRGMAFIQPQGAHPGHTPQHRIYVHNMLVTTKNTDIVPSWAYFVRIVANADHLKPTASRESLFDDDLLEETRQSIGAQLRGWLADLSHTSPDEFARFIAVHVTSLKSLAVADEKTRRLVMQSVPYQTSLGMKTLDEVLAENHAIRYTTTDDRFRSLCPVAQANGLCIVNAGFAYDTQLLEQVVLDMPDTPIAELDPRQLLDVLKPVDPSKEVRYLDFIGAAEKALSGQPLVVELRGFAPSTMPVLYLPDPEAVGLTLAPRVEKAAGGIYEGLLDIMSQGEETSRSPRLIFNASSSIINELAAATGKADTVVESAIRALYVQALLAGRHPMDAQVRAWAANLFTPLIAESLKSDRGFGTDHRPDPSGPTRTDDPGD